uniref:Uncharacterized protein n=1 Tax=Panagrellus redivivus TaxID=6233 RepID=A0A7E4ZV39_PANRE
MTSRPRILIFTYITCVTAKDVLFNREQVASVGLATGFVGILLGVVFGFLIRHYGPKIVRWGLQRGGNPKHTTSSAVVVHRDVESIEPIRQKKPPARERLPEKPKDDIQENSSDLDAVAPKQTPPRRIAPCESEVEFNEEEMAKSPQNLTKTPTTPIKKSKSVTTENEGENIEEDAIFVSKSPTPSKPTQPRKNPFNDDIASKKKKKRRT